MKIKNHRDIINHWPTLEAFCVDMDAKYHTAYSWKERGIPSKYWDLLIRQGKKYKLKLTAKILMNTMK